jgi:endonuclease G
MRKNNSLLWVILLVILVVVIVNVCRRQSATNGSTQNTTRVASDNSNMLLGNPTNAAQSSSNTDNYLIDHKYYIESYNSLRNIPNWVSWHIAASDLGSADRLDDFRPDNNLPGGWYAVSPNNYKGSGFDKGHNCPSGDRTASQEANSSTFLMDNIIPQAPRNNEQTWEHLESYCRDKVKAGNEVYVVMGNYGIGGTGSRGYRTNIGYGKVTVPAHIWKVVVIIPDGNNDLARINNKTQVIAIDTPNDNSISPNWMNYVTTVNDIQDNCSCDLLSALPQALQNQLEHQRFAGGN